MRVYGWWSPTGEILVAMDIDTARNIANDIGAQYQVQPPELKQLCDQLKAAVRESPVAGVGP